MRKHRLRSGCLFGCLLTALGISQAAGAQTNYGQVNIGSNASATVTVSIANAGTLGSIAVVTQGAPNLDFTSAVGGTCSTGTAYAANATCTVNVTFAPGWAGARYGAVVLADANGVIGTTYLQGTGVGPQTVFLPGSQSTVASFTSEISWTSAVSVDGNGNLYVTDYDRFGDSQSLLLKETLTGGTYVESTVPTSVMNAPYGVAVDGGGNIYVTDTSNWRVLKETPWAGGYSESTVVSFPMVDGAAPIGVAVDGSGNVYVSVGSDGGAVYMETPTATSYTQSTVISGLPAVAGIAVDGAGVVYMAINETGSGIVKEIPSASGYTQSTIPVTGGGLPFALAVDGSGSIYVAFTDNDDNGQIFKETATSTGYVQSTLPVFGLDQPGGLAVDGSGNLYIADSYNSRVVKEDFADTPSLSFAATPQGMTSSDSPQTVSASNIGNSALAFSAVSYPSDFPLEFPEKSNCAVSIPLAAGASCTLPVSFLPLEPLNGMASQLLTEDVTITTNALNIAADQQAIQVSGTETLPLPAVATPAFSPSPGVYTSVQSVTLSDATPGAEIFYRTDGGSLLSGATLYTSGTPIIVSATETIRVIAMASGYSLSAVASGAYTINLPPPDFSITDAPATLTLEGGQSGTTTISVTPANGFNAVISFSCSGLPAGASCSFSPSTVTPSGAAASTILTVTTAPTMAALRRPSIPLFPGSTLAVALCCLGFRRRRLQSLLLVVVSLTGLNLLAGCGGGSPHVLPVTSTVTVTAVSGSLQRTATFSLTVN